MGEIRLFLNSISVLLIILTPTIMLALMTDEMASSSLYNIFFIAKVTCFVIAILLLNRSINHYFSEKLEHPID